MPTRFLAHREPEILPFRLYTTGYQEQSHLMRHEGFSASQVLLTRAGRGVVRQLGDAFRPVDAGQVLFIRSGVPHEYYPVSEEPWEVRFVSFAGTMADQLLDVIGFGEMALMRAETGPLWAIMDCIWDAAGNKDEWAASRATYELLLELLRQTSHDRAESEQACGPKQAQDAVVDLSVAFLNEHYPEPILLSQMAQSLGYSQQHLNRLFRSRYGITPQRYLRQLRMQRAVFLLGKHPGMTIKEVARLVGLDAGHFIRTFRMEFGSPPGKLRAEMKV
ncbi:helix-turn-helix transcriptional regulator [Cohnella hashimotonis]|uniref:AraC family transcriptional regulator n=1 Tax=Cohnella hashimotonis TaxID=2826895 RepID=A0ABT6TA33_9BACL|nr:AraC family transcriptional regulator [Cohnella hashimotonis]MDI4643693.1 AraC family transcriptional regulator [Cohnella hashimotonis]